MLISVLFFFIINLFFIFYKYIRVILNINTYSIENINYRHNPKKLEILKFLYFYTQI